MMKLGTRNSTYSCWPEVIISDFGVHQITFSELLRTINDSGRNKKKQKIQDFDEILKISTHFLPDIAGHKPRCLWK